MNKRPHDFTTASNIARIQHRAYKVLDEFYDKQEKKPVKKEKPLMYRYRLVR